MTTMMATTPTPTATKINKCTRIELHRTDISFSRHRLSAIIKLNVLLCHWFRSYSNNYQHQLNEHFSQKEGRRRKKQRKICGFFSFSRKWLTIQPKQITHTCTVFRNRKTRAAPTRPRPTDRFRRHTQFHWISWTFVWSRFHVRRGFFTWNCYVVDFFLLAFCSFARSFARFHCGIFFFIFTSITVCLLSVADFHFRIFRVNHTHTVLVDFGSKQPIQTTPIALITANICRKSRLNEI